MQLPEILTDKAKQEDLKEKVQVAFAVLTITSFAIKKIKNNTTITTVYEEENIS